MYATALCLVAIVAATALVVALVWVLYVPLIARSIEKIPWLAAEYGAAVEDGEECRFQTADGLSLGGTYLPTSAPARLGVIACCHELTGDRWTMLPYAADLRRRGYDVFAFDFRNHGASDAVGRYHPTPWLTWHELVDVRAALDYLTSRTDADPRGVGLIGLSRGGAAALAGASRDRRVRAIVTDGAFATATMQVHYIRRYMAIFTLLAPLFARLPDWVLGALASQARWLVARRQSVVFVDVEQAARRLHQPVLMIHGELDPFVPREVVDALRRLLPWRTKLWIVSGARHNGALDTARAEYERRIARFFHKHLAAGRRSALSETAGSTKFDSASALAGQRDAERQIDPRTQA